ncbi:hypothetical protein E2562_034120 [Oryza meyeriana var. granulata]|uniref:Uncharacterized protein n=1 Tax=Oryza meyeriana var. granulata TaxID=110450 RepID=A0A6G1E6I5_9ORYZ|nr:hypothetical protein E2562_034120 [Oryza meyeriana var. granulata]
MSGRAARVRVRYGWPLTPTLPSPRQPVALMTTSLESTAFTAAALVSSWRATGAVCVVTCPCAPAAAGGRRKRLARQLPRTQKMFDGMPVKTVVSWNVLLDGLVRANEDHWFATGNDFDVPADATASASPRVLCLPAARRPLLQVLELEGHEGCRRQALDGSFLTLPEY